MASSSLPKSVFQSKAGKPSIDDKELLRIMDKPTWHTTHAQGLHVVPAAWQLLVHLQQTGAWTLGANAWKACFALPGFVLQHRSTGDFSLVLHSCQFGFVSWPLDVTDRQPRFASPKTTADAHYQWGFVLDFNDWSCWAFDIVPPVATSIMKAPIMGIHLKLSNAPQSLVQAAACEGFRGVTQTWLEKARACGAGAAGDVTELGRQCALWAPMGPY